MTTALPWRPIAELPDQPHVKREFLLYREIETNVVVWCEFGQRNKKGLEMPGWGDGLGNLYPDHELRSIFTHFIEITPPTAA